MKSSVAITLIVVGALLVMLPPVSDYLYTAKVAEALSRPGVTSVDLDGKMGDLYRIGCILLGAFMIVPAIMGSIGSPDRKPDAAAPA